MKNGPKQDQKRVKVKKRANKVQDCHKTDKFFVFLSLAKIVSLLGGGERRLKTATGGPQAVVGGNDRGISD